MQIFVRVFAVASCLILVGCGPDGPALGEVTGIIKLDGQPIENAYVQFLPTDPNHGIEMVGKTDANGKYEMAYSADRDGVLLGNYQVLVSTLDDIKLESGANKKVPELIPAIYVNEESPLYFEVKAGENDASFDIPSKPEKD